ncbi:hypothetical protein ACFWN2_04305 [Lentzea sp. NPDC058436]|uniref:hypothetical protein n=1 Tax=Lentzea sp. NPDC058436 TaxID=3346499 RepID=UPI003648C892
MKSIARIAFAYERRKSAQVTVVRPVAGSTPEVLRISHMSTRRFATPSSTSSPADREEDQRARLVQEMPVPEQLTTAMQTNNV